MLTLSSYTKLFSISNFSLFGKRFIYPVKVSGLLMEVLPSVVNAVYPVEKVRLFNGGFEVIRGNKLKGDYKTSGGERRAITELSKKSLSALAFLVATTDITFNSIMTLTYPKEYSTDGSRIKQDLREFLTKHARMVGNYSYLWFLEFQTRGAPHFHILSTSLAPNRWMVLGFSELWSSIAARSKDGLELFHVKQLKAKGVHLNGWEGVREIEGAKRYALKYALKKEQKAVPKNYANCGRFWGSSYDVKSSGGTVVDIDEGNFREMLASGASPCCNWEILPKFIIDRRQGLTDE